MRSRITFDIIFYFYLFTFLQKDGIKYQRLAWRLEIGVIAGMLYLGDWLGRIASGFLLSFYQLHGSSIWDVMCWFGVKENLHDMVAFIRYSCLVLIREALFASSIKRDICLE